MARLLIHVEGPTEESFVNNVLRDHLVAGGYESVGARLLGNARQRHHRGGIRGWHAVKGDIVRHLKEDRGCIATTMVDYYGLPQSGTKEWPGRRQANDLDVSSKAPTVEAAIQTDLNSEMGGNFDANRFVPFVVLHEFEGLLFSNCNAFARGIGRPAIEPKFEAIRNQFTTPEEINDSPNTAPSKRVAEVMPEYEKPLHGTLAAMEIGLETIRQACPHFEDWLGRLEGLAA